jgi:hypothetical protein
VTGSRRTADGCEGVVDSSIRGVERFLEDRLDMLDIFLQHTKCSHVCLPAYNASLQGPSTCSDSQLSAYNASLQVQPNQL